NETVITGFAQTTIGGIQVPVVNWQTEPPMSTKACVGGTVTVTETGENTQTYQIETVGPVTLTEAPAGSGTVTGHLPKVVPIHGPVVIAISITGCPNPEDDEKPEFSIYVDPSGTVVDGNNGDAPISGATVTLLASAVPSGPFTAVPNGSIVM